MWELTEETIDLPLGCLQGGFRPNKAFRANSTAYTALLTAFKALGTAFKALSSTSKALSTAFNALSTDLKVPTTAFRVPLLTSRAANKSCRVNFAPLTFFSQPAVPRGEGNTA